MKAKFVSNILRPKSKEDIEKEFINLTVSEQVDILNDLSNEDKEIFISEKYWPLIQRIKKRLKENKSFDSLFRCSFTLVMQYSLGTMVKFKIYNRNDNLAIISRPVEVYQNDDEPSSINISFRGKNYEIKTYEGVINFFNRHYVDVDGNTVHLSK